MNLKREHALLDDRLVSRICVAVVAKLEQEIFRPVPSKQGVAGLNPVSRSIDSKLNWSLPDRLLTHWEASIYMGVQPTYLFSIKVGAQIAFRNIS